MIQITSICRGYLTNADRKRAIAHLKRQGFDHFVEYQDVSARYALCYGVYNKTPPAGKPAKARVVPVQLSLNQWIIL
jgi:hypothetical protein